MSILKQAVKNILLKLQSVILDKLLRTRNIWKLLDKLKIPGFGIHLVRFFYPISTLDQPQWGGASPPHAKILELLQKREQDYEVFLDQISGYFNDLKDWPIAEQEGQLMLPYLTSEFISIADGGSLYGMLRYLKPKLFLEVGSGMSTKIANHARLTGGFEMKIVSIDPEPRQAIDTICDQVVRKPFEQVEIIDLPELSAGDVFFFDGSHYTFPGNDVVHFFFNILDQIPKGVYIHIHDIFWPDDYPPEFLKHFWTEQYVLGAWLLGGSKGVEVAFPVHYMANSRNFNECIDSVYKHYLDQFSGDKLPEKHGSSFWLMKV